jgi:hypothetical protein
MVPVPGKAIRAYHVVKKAIRAINQIRNFLDVVAFQRDSSIIDSVRREADSRAERTDNRAGDSVGIEPT